MCTGVHGADSARSIGHALTSFSETDCSPCPLEQSCMAMHGEHMEAQPPMGLKGDTDEGGVRSYQVPSEVQDEVGQSMRREDEALMRHIGCTGVHEAGGNVHVQWMTLMHHASTVEENKRRRA